MSNGILVLCEHGDGAFKKTAYELLGKAVELAAIVGGPVSAVVIGHDDGAELGAAGASTVYVASGAPFEAYNTGPYVRALQAAIAAADPAVVLAPASPSARDAIPRLAARLGAGMGTEVTDLRAEGGKVIGRRPVYGGKAFVDVRVKSSLSLFTVRPNSFPVAAPTGGKADLVALSLDLTEADQRTRVVGTEAPSSKVADLTEADRIVSGGRSLKSAEAFDSVIRPLSAAIGATTGASRAAVDAGYARHSEQVGQTGKTVNPSLYIAAGISGAIQHLAGMRTSRVIVAINKDPEAPIFGIATYGIVADLFEICPLLTAEFEKALST